MPDYDESIISNVDVLTAEWVEAPAHEEDVPTALVLERALGSLEIDPTTATEVAEQGFSAGAAVLELGREFLVEVAKPERISALCQVWNCDAPTALARVITDWRNMISGARGDGEREIVQGVYNHLYDLAYANLSKQLGEVVAFDPAVAVDPQVAKFAQHYGLGRIHFHKELEALPWLAKMRAATARRLHMPAALEREAVEHSNSVLLEHLQGEGSLDPESIVVEVSPPIHHFQHKLMLRCHYFRDGVWVSDQFALPAVEDHVAFHTQLQATLSGWQRLRDQVQQHDTRDQVLADVIVTPPLYSLDEVLEQVFSIYNNYAQTTLPITPELIAENDATIAAAFAPAESQLHDFIALLLDDVALMASDANLRTFWKQRYDEVLTACVACFTPQSELEAQGFSQEDIDIITSTDTIRAGIRGSLGDRVAATSRGELRVHASSDCGVIDRTIGQSSPQPSSRVSQPMGPITTHNREGIPLEWRTVLKKGVPTRVLRCPVCGHPELDPCWDTCPGCQNSTTDMRLRYESGNLAQLRAAHQAQLQQATQARIFNYSQAETNATEGLWGQLLSGLAIPFQRVLQVLEVEG